MHTFSVISGFLEEPTWQHCNKDKLNLAKETKTA